MKTLEIYKTYSKKELVEYFGYDFEIKGEYIDLEKDGFEYSIREYDIFTRTFFEVTWVQSTEVKVVTDEDEASEEEESILSQVELDQRIVRTKITDTLARKLRCKKESDLTKPMTLKKQDIVLKSYLDLVDGIWCLDGVPFNFDGCIEKAYEKMLSK
ncbi:MAG: hypothetical protein ACRCZZ_11025 [Phocaeicola sp.]